MLCGGYGFADHLVEVFEPALKEVRAIDGERFIGTEGGVNLGGVVAGIVGSVMFEGIVGVIGRAHGRDIEFLEETLGGKVGGLEGVRWHYSKFHQRSRGTVMC